MLQTITFPEDVSYFHVGEYAFENCTSLELMEFEGMFTVETGAFSGCTSLKYVEASGIASFYDSAFENCTMLTTVRISPEVTLYGNGIFEGCTSLTTIIFDGTEQEWNDAEKGAEWNRGIENCVISFTV
jgi:hypothetical protein